MVAYIILILWIFGLYSFLRCIRLQRVNKVRFYVLAVSWAMILLLGLRHPSMGVDLGYGTAYGYLASFQTLADMSWSEIFHLENYLNYERGYLLLNKLVGVFSTSEQYFLFVCAILSILPIGMTIMRYSRNCRISFCIYIGLSAFMMTFSGLRQAIAMALVFGGFGLIREKKLKQYILLVLLASTLHATSLVALLAYPMYWMRLDRSARMVTLGAIPVLFVLRSALWNLIVRITGRSSEAVSNGAIVLFLLFCGIYVYTILFSREKSSHDGLMNLLFVCCCILTMTEVSQLVQRVAYYFMLYLTLLLPEVLEGIREYRGKSEYMLHAALVTGGFLALFLYNMRVTDWAMAYPYYFFWQNVT